MNIMKKILPVLLSLSLLFSFGAVTAAGEEPRPEQDGAASRKIQELTVEEDAILYTVSSENELVYNVTHSAQLSKNVAVTDLSENGIDSLKELKKALGTPDLPAPRLGTDPGQRSLGDAVRANLGFNKKGKIVSVQIVSVQERPIIGISWRHDAISEDYQKHAEAFERNGALAVYLPRIGSEAEAAAVLRSVSGIFVTGGEGWNPSRYGQVQLPHGSSNYNKERDDSDLLLIRGALEEDVPMLAVCRGAQGINIALGGELIQDIPYYLGQKVISGEIDASRVTAIVSGTIPDSVPGYDQLPERLKRSVQDSGYKMVNMEGGLICHTYNKETDTYDTYNGAACMAGHLRVRVDGLSHGKGYHPLQGGDGNENVAISRDSRWLYEMFGTDTLETVLSLHHQAVDPEHLGEGVSIAARSSDGIVEAIEVPSASFALGLQWHPEKDALEDSRETDVDQDACNVPLSALVQHAAEKAAQRLIPQPIASHDADGKPGLSWESIDDAVSYQVYRSTTGEPGSFKRLKTVTENAYVNVKAEAGTTWWYKVRSVTAAGRKSELSEPIRVTARPDAPKVKGTLSKEGKPVLTWKAISGAVKYQIFCSETGVAGSFDWVANTADTHFVYARAEAGKTFWYKVRAVTEDDTKGGYDEPVRLTAAPAAPVVVGSLSDTGKPALRWQAVEGAVKYQIFRSATGEEGSFTRIKTVKVLEHVNQNARAGRTYWYCVRAVNEEGTLGAFSESVKLTAAKEPIPAPTPTPEPVRSYQIFVEDVSWEEASRRCEEKGGHLAVVRNAEELEQIKALAEESGAVYVWLGCRRVDGQLQWVTGESVAYYLWRQGEPSYRDSYDDAAEDYLLLWKLRGEWSYNDSREDPVKDFPTVYRGRIAYVCEFDS